MFTHTQLRLTTLALLAAARFQLLLRGAEAGFHLGRGLAAHGGGGRRFLRALDQQSIGQGWAGQAEQGDQGQDKDATAHGGFP